MKFPGNNFDFGNAESPVIDRRESMGVARLEDTDALTFWQHYRGI